MSIRPLLRPIALGAHLLAIALVSAAVALGLWQLGSWQEHREDAAAERRALDPVPLSEAMGPDEPFQKDQVGRRIVASGTWLPESTVYVSGRPHGDDDGYWAMTPLAVATPEEPSGSALLVVRGWVPEPARAPAPPTGEATVVGWLQPPEGSAGVVDDDRTDDVIPQVRMADAIQHVDRDLYGAYAVLDPGGELENAGHEGLRAADLDQLPEVSASTGLKNLLYAVEWWIFAAFAGFIWWRWCADELASDRASRLEHAG